MEKETLNRKPLGEFELEEHGFLIGKKSFKVKLPDMREKVFEAEVNGKSVRVELLDDVCCGKPIFLSVERKLHKVELDRTSTDTSIRVKVDGIPYRVRVEGKNRANLQMFESTLPIAKRNLSVAQGFDKGAISASMPGKVALLRVKPGDLVNVGDVLLVLESMKMENEIVSPVAGTVKEVKVSEGSAVSLGETMVVIDET